MEARPRRAATGGRGFARTRGAVRRLCLLAGATTAKRALGAGGPESEEVDEDEGEDVVRSESAEVRDDAAVEEARPETPHALARDLRSGQRFAFRSL